MKRKIVQLNLVSSMVCQFIHMLCFITWIPEFKFCTLSPSKYLQHVTS